MWCGWNNLVVPAGTKVVNKPKLRGLEDLGVFCFIYYPLELLLLLLLPPPLLELLLLDVGVVIFFNRSYQNEDP